VAKVGREACAGCGSAPLLDSSHPAPLGARARARPTPSSHRTPHFGEGLTDAGERGVGGDGVQERDARAAGDEVLHRHAVLILRAGTGSGVRVRAVPSNTRAAGRGACGVWAVIKLG